MVACFFFNDTATTEIYTLSLHDALPISFLSWLPRPAPAGGAPARAGARWLIRLELRAGPGVNADCAGPVDQDRKSTRLNSSHSQISYAVFCLIKTEDRRAGGLRCAQGRV